MTAGGRSSELWDLEESTCLALLGTQHVGRLILPGDDPHVVVVNFAADGDRLVFRTEPETTLATLVDGAHVVFEVDMYDHRTQSGWSVVLRGDARCIEPHESPLPVEPWGPGDKACWVLIEARRVTGRLLRGEVPPSWNNPGGYL